MTDDKVVRDNTEAHQELDSRLREIEISHSSLSSTIVSMNGNINEMKQMFQKFLIDSERISEMAGKIESISRIEKEAQAIGSKYDEMYKEFIILKHTCSTCTINKVNDYIKDMSDKVSKIESSLDELKGSKSKLNGFWNNISQTIVTIIILYLLYIVAMNIQFSGNIIANPPDIKKGNNTEFVSEAQATLFTNKTTATKGIKKNVKDDKGMVR